MLNWLKYGSLFANKYDSRTGVAELHAYIYAAKFQAEYGSHVTWLQENISLSEVVGLKRPTTYLIIDMGSF